MAETSLSCPVNMHALVSVLWCSLCFQRIPFYKHTTSRNTGWTLQISDEFRSLYRPSYDMDMHVLMGKRELVSLLNLSSWCLVTVGRLFLAVPWGVSAVCDCGIS